MTSFKERKKYSKYPKLKSKIRKNEFHNLKQAKMLSKSDGLKQNSRRRAKLRNNTDSNVWLTHHKLQYNEVSIPQRAAFMIEWLQGV